MLLPSIWKERLGEVTRLQLSCATINDIGGLIAIHFIGSHTLAMTEIRLNRITFKMAENAKLKVTPTALYANTNTPIDTAIEGNNVINDIINSSQIAVLNSFLKSAPQVI